MCVYVKGDLTVLGNLTANSQTLVQVYGNAYIQGNAPDNKHKHTKLQVLGETYINGIKVTTDDYKNISDYNGKCDMNITWSDREEVDTSTQEYKWDLNSSLNTIYH